MRPETGLRIYQVDFTESYQREIDVLLASLPSHTPEPDRLYSIDHLRSLFLCFSLSDDSIQFHAQAKQLSNHLSVLLRDTRSVALQTTLHTLNERMRSDQTTLVFRSSLIWSMHRV